MLEVEWMGGFGLIGLVWWDGWSHWGEKCGRLIGWLFMFVVSCVG